MRFLGSDRVRKPFLAGGLFVLCCSAVLFSGTSADAACNLIPSAARNFRGHLGTANKPYAAPGDFVEVGLRTGICDGASAGFEATAGEHNVSVIFKPPNGGPQRVAFLTTGSCAGPTATAQLAACEAVVGAGNVGCFGGTSSGLALVTRNGVERVSFRFPDTDALFAPDGDDQTLTGPVAIAVTPVADPLPCGLATDTCSETSTLACVDSLYAPDGSCNPNPHPLFNHFTALPVLNDFAAECYTDSPPCTLTASEARATLDADGNLLLPVNWNGVLVRANSLPVPRLLRATVQSPLPMATPPTVALGSFTPEGAPLPPIFEPQSDPSSSAPDVITLFGTADAAYTVLRLARAVGECQGVGPNAGNPCLSSGDCAGDACAAVCIDGTMPQGTTCSVDGDCGVGGRCGNLYEDLRPLISGGGPFVFPRQPGPGICQEAPHDACTDDMDCVGVLNACVHYSFEARTPVPLEGLAGSDDVFTFSVRESIAAKDLNGDGDLASNDLVLVVQDRETGQPLPLGFGGAVGRAVANLADPPFRFPANDSEAEVVAFLEPEPLQGVPSLDKNGDADDADLILRAYRQDGASMVDGTSGADLTAAADLSINGLSLIVSEGLVFFRTEEEDEAFHFPANASVATDGTLANASSIEPDVSADGRFVAFQSSASNLIGPGGDTNGVDDIFVRDLRDETTERVSVSTLDAAADAEATSASISADGRFVAFASFATTLLDAVPDPGIEDVFVHDRMTGTTERVSVSSTEVAGSHNSNEPSISADGRFVAFTSLGSNLNAPDPDTNTGKDVFVRDRLLGTTERISEAADGTEATGFAPSISADGRYVAFQSTSPNLLGPGNDTNLKSDVFVRDRLEGTVELISVTAGGAQANQNSEQAKISADGRFVIFISEATNLLGPGGDTNGEPDVFVRDRLLGTTERVTVSSDGRQVEDANGLLADLSADGRTVVFSIRAFDGDGTTLLQIWQHDRLTGITELASVTSAGVAGDSFSTQPSISGDGRVLAFRSVASNLGGNPGFFNIIARVADPTDVPSDLTADGDLDDTLLRVLDTATGVVTNLCPATEVAVTDGKAAFLRPESGGTATNCPDGSILGDGVDLNGDGDTDDLVVQVWTEADGVTNLGLAATAVALSSTHVAAIQDDESVLVQPLAGIGARSSARGPVPVAWTDTGADASSLQFCGETLAFQAPASEDFELGLYDPTLMTPTVVDTAQPAEEIACTDSLVAFRTREATVGLNLNGAPANPNDVDLDDDVLQVWALTDPACRAVGAPASCLLNSGRAVTPCFFETCDPRVPYLASGDRVKFLTLECDQGGVETIGCASGGTDLNDDGDAADIVIHVFDLDTDTVTVVGATSALADSNPLAGGDADQSGAVYETYGLCLEATGGGCADDGDCDGAESCHDGTCKREHSTCTTNADCPPSIDCDTVGTRSGSVPASPDTDDDGVPDHIDNCPDVPNADQADPDGDDVGEACDLDSPFNTITTTTLSTTTTSTTSTSTTSTSTTSTTSTTMPDTGMQVPVAGRKIQLKDDAGRPEKRKASIVIEVPAVEGHDIAPTVGGASLHLFNSAGGTDSVCLDLPASLWSGSAGKWKYADKKLVEGPVKQAQLKKGVLKLKVQGNGPTELNYTLDEPAQTSVGVFFREGSVAYCTEFGGTVQKDSGTDPPNVGGKGQFKAKDVEVAPVACPVEPQACP